MNKEDKITLTLWAIGASTDLILAVWDFGLGAYNIVQHKYVAGGLLTFIGFVVLVLGLRYARNFILYIWIFRG